MILKCYQNLQFNPVSYVFLAPGALVPKRSDSPAKKHDQGKITDQNALNNKYFQGDEKGSVCKKLLIQ